jgi:hypothetical protein
VQAKKYRAATYGIAAVGNQSCVALTPGLEIIIDAHYPARQTSTPPECSSVSIPARAGGRPIDGCGFREKGMVPR